MRQLRGVLRQLLLLLEVVQRRQLDGQRRLRRLVPVEVLVLLVLLVLRLRHQLIVELSRRVALVLVLVLLLEVHDGRLLHEEHIGDEVVLGRIGVAGGAA
jgi:hypothetical protein